MSTPHKKRDNKCFFCDNVADSKEDVWPKWILKKIRSSRPVAMFGFAGKRDIYYPGYALPSRCVCIVCNNGWMSDLERASGPIIGSMIEGLTIPLDAAQRWTVSLWALKTAMVMESSNRRHMFYTPEERLALRVSGILPPFTVVWIGRYSGRFHLAHFGVGVWDDVPESPNASQGYVTTIVVGRLVIQSFTFHRSIHRKGAITINPNPGPWDRLLIQIAGREIAKSVIWPPELFMDDDGLQALARRWSMGTALDRD